MEEIFRSAMSLLLVTNVLIPFLVVWILIKYVFQLRKRQDDEFLKNLGHVVRKAVSEALNDVEDKKND